MASTAIPRRGAATGRAALFLRDTRNWLFLVPTLIFFVGWQVYPIFRVLWMSFTDYHFLRREPAQWVGLLNYANAFADPWCLPDSLGPPRFPRRSCPALSSRPSCLRSLADRSR